MTVQTILSRKGRNVVTIEPSATLQAAIATLAEHRIGAVVVLGADRPSLGARCRTRICGIRRGCVNQTPGASHDPRGCDLWGGRVSALYHGADDHRQVPTHSGNRMR